MTDVRQDSAEADDDSFMNIYFDRALRRHEMESAKTRHSGSQGIARAAAELPPHRAHKKRQS